MPSAQVTVNDAATDSATPVHLKISSSYPAPPFRPEDPNRDMHCKWGRASRSACKGNLEVTLLERIAEGRIGVTYRARVDKAVTEEGVDITASMPATVCLKFAKQQYCPSLAREAWHYEQLRRWKGICIPKFYGFYESRFKEQGITADQFEPWFDLEVPSLLCAEHVRDPEFGEPLDRLQDDTAALKFGSSQFKHKSPWSKWKPQIANPTIAVIVMEFLGKPCGVVWQDWPPEKYTAGESAFKQDILDALDDLHQTGFCHNDPSGWNILQYDGPQTERRRCPRHGVIHGWRFIDFDRSHKLDMNHATSAGLLAQDNDKWSIGDKGFFWGARTDVTATEYQFDPDANPES